MKIFMDLKGSAPANDVDLRIEGSLLRLYFGYNKEEASTSETTGSGTIIDGDKDTEPYSCENIDIEGGSRTYAEITAAIINDKYDNNSVQAIIANKALADDTKSDITDTKRAEYLQEYNDFQAYREKAKEVATKAVAMLDDLKKADEGSAASENTADSSSSSSSSSSESTESTSKSSSNSASESAASTGTSSSSKSK